jgi:hypothetical protein
MEGVMNAEEAREHIAKALREEYDRLFQAIKELQAAGVDTTKLQTLSGAFGGRCKRPNEK